MRRMLMVGLSLALGLVGIVPAAAQVTTSTDETGELNGAAYEIRVPDEWNGTLVAYAHGYRDKADHDGEVDDRSAQAFIAEPFEDLLLAEGYALAGSAYRDNGWAVREGIADTRNLVNYFRATVGEPDTTILVGLSMGSVVTHESVENYPGLYDGAIPSCAVSAGAPRAFDGTLALALAYDAVYGWPAAWGTPHDVRDDLDFDTEVAPVLAAQLFAADGPAKFEFMRLVTGVPIGPEWPFSNWFFTTEGRAELERRAGGPVGQNLDHVYAISGTDAAYLEALGLDGASVDGFVAAMNAEDVAAEPSNRYVEKWADYTGRLKRPVMTLGTVVDALVPPSHVSKYNETVAAAGSSDLVVNAFTSGEGHCNFTPDQMLTAVNAMQSWIVTGSAPDVAGLPADQGFVAYTPPPWPQP